MDSPLDDSEQELSQSIRQAASGYSSGFWMIDLYCLFMLNLVSKQIIFIANEKFTPNCHFLCLVRKRLRHSYV
jgi:hypothetical protein